MSSTASDQKQRIGNDFDVDEILAELTGAEKIALVSGADFWHLASVPRLGIPSVRTSDGPNGVRGTKFFNGVPAACFPCGTGLASTWDTGLIREGGKLMADEALAKGAAVILGPTVNMQRGPLGGRGFESYSEDPVLSGNMAAACVQGIQSKGVAAVIKHFVCNDLEDRRMASDSIVSERALREIYLKPFQIAQRDARPASYMTAYNRLNGTHCSENPRLLQTILREEWGFDGMVMSDWFGTYSAQDSLKAGLDLEMPGPSYIRGASVSQALTSGKLLPHELDTNVQRVLRFIKQTLPLEIAENASETTIDTPQTAAVLRKTAADSIVLLRNQNKILPFSKEKTTAVIGPNAEFAAYSGGGSASLLPYRAVSPLEGVKAQVKNVHYELGAPGWKWLPLVSEITKTASGKPGLDITVYLDPPSTNDRAPVDSVETSSGKVWLFDYKNPKVPTTLFYCDIDGLLTPDETAEYEFSCSVAGTAKVFVDGELVVDNATKQTAGDSFFGAGTIEEMGSIKLEKGKTYKYHVEFGTLPTMTLHKSGATAMAAGGCRLGCYRKIDMKTERERAVQAAKNADQVVLCIGLNSDWESEGYDRVDMDLPPGSDELVKAVLAANPNTVVVNQSGTPVTMAWAQEAAALVQAWFGGNEIGHAIADVVFGDVCPGGKLSLSFPWKNSDNPSFLTFNSDDNRTFYGEDIYVGYRYYEKADKPVAFPFGFGLSYTSFDMNSLDVSAAGEDIVISVDVTNTGDVDGSEVVQVYFAAAEPATSRPLKELKGFTKVHVEAGQTKKAEVRVAEKYATSYWSGLRDAWVSEKGAYRVLVGNSSDNTPLIADYNVKKTLCWTGL